MSSELYHNIVAKKLEGKVTIITGGASGIGEATARLFAYHGAKVVIADIQDNLGQELSESIGLGRCTYIHCDVTHEDQVKSLVAATVHMHGRLDIMFSNAGIMSRPELDQTVLDFDLDELDKVFAVNVRGMAACVKHAARAMVEGHVRGNIICTASVAARSAGAKGTDYGMSKVAVVGLVRSASKQLGKHGIRVNSVSPFAVATPLLCRSHGKEEGEVEKIYQHLTSLKDEALKVEHVADAVLFLASEQSRFVTGHDLVVDGGCTV